MDHAFLFNIFIFLAATCCAVPLASRFKLGAVLGYLIAGIVIGPFGFGFIAHSEEIQSFAEFGVVMMLFVIGLDLEPSKLWRLRHHIMGLGGLQVTITSGVLMLAAMALGFSWSCGLAMGMALSLSSTALVLRRLQERNLMQTAVGEAAFSTLLFQDIAVIPILIILPLLGGATDAEIPSQQASFLNDLPGWAHALAVAVVIGAVIVVGRYLSSWLFDVIAKTNQREVFTATSLLLVIGTTILMQLVGISPALGAFVAGVVLANSEYKRTLETDIEPFKGLLLGLFFISVGMGMDFNLFAREPLQLLAVVVGLMSVKAVILWGLGRLFKLTPLHNLGFALGLCQVGEFAFVLLQLSGGLNIMSTEHARFLTLVVALSIGLTPFLLMGYTRFVVPRFMSLLPTREFDAIERPSRVILAGYGRFGQIIGRFLIAQGIEVTILEKDPGQIAVLRKFGVKAYFGDATRVDLLHNAGAGQASLLLVAIDDADECLTIVREARAAFPNLKIFARARNRRHAYELHKAGVHYFKRELFDSALSMAQEAMVTLGRRESDIQYRAQQFLRHDEATLKQSFAFFDNERELVDFTRFRTAELETILRSDSVDEPVPDSLPTNV